MGATNNQGDKVQAYQQNLTPIGLLESSSDLHPTNKLGCINTPVFRSICAATPTYRVRAYDYLNAKKRDEDSGLSFPASNSKHDSNAIPGSNSRLTNTKKQTGKN
jgi:hypothetical protein